MGFVLEKKSITPVSLECALLNPPPRCKAHALFSPGSWTVFLDSQSWGIPLWNN